MGRASLEKQPHEVAAMFDDVAERYDVTNDVLSLGQDAGLAPGRRARLDAAPGRARARPRGRHRHARRAVPRGRRRRGAVRLLPRHAAGRQAARAGPAASWPATRCGCRSPTTRSTRSRSSFGLRNVVDPAAGPARDARGSPAGRPAGGLRVQPADVAGRSARSTRSTSCARCRRWPARCRSNPDAYVYLAESIRAWPDQRGAGGADRGGRLGPPRVAATSPAGSWRCTAATRP